MSRREFQLVIEPMHKSAAKLILLSFCFQGLMLVPAFAQAVAPADGRVGTPVNAPIAGTTADAAANVPTAPSAAPTNVSSYILGPEDQITVRIFAAGDIPDRPVQIDNDGSVTLPMIRQVHAAGLTVEQLQDNPSEVRSRVEELRKQAIQISDDVQALSHELDSSKLERLGAIGGMRSWCKEFAERQRIQVEFRSPEAKISLPREIGLCLIRVLQEALHNAAKYSGVSRIEVQLWEDSGEIHLLVSDSGRGFDLETAMEGRGLGLTSMQERVRLIKGIIEIQSKPMSGTKVHVHVPLMSGHSQRAAG